MVGLWLPLRVVNPFSRGFVVRAPCFIYPEKTHFLVSSFSSIFSTVIKQIQVQPRKEQMIFSITLVLKHGYY